MHAEATESNATRDDESLEHEFDAERRKKMILGVAVLVFGALATLGILYYFGATSAVGW